MQHDPNLYPRDRLASALRILLERIMEHELSDATLDRIGETVVRLQKQLAAHPRRLRHVGFDPVGENRLTGIFDYGMKNFSPVSGPGNPLSPPLTLHMETDRVLGSVNFRTPFSGRDGCAHHGLVAAVFDEILGAALSLTGTPGLTGILEVRYHHPVPMRETLSLESRIQRVRGPLVFTEGSLHAGGRLTAEAEGIFFKIDESIYQGFAEERNRKINADV